MKNILICQHGGSANHGCEALARTAVSLLNLAEREARIELYSYRREDDEKYLQDIDGLRISGLNGLPGKYSLHNLLYHWKKRMLHDENASKLPLTAEFCQAVAKADLVVAIGGDNYCYQRGQGYYALDRYIKNQGKPYVLLGASVEPADLPLGLARHLLLFELVTARENISYQGMRDYGLNNVALTPDAAFLLPAEQTRLPNGFTRGNTVGINISPLIMQREQKSGITLDNYRALIKYILGNSKMQVALIPHVVIPGNDDRVILAALKQEFAENARVFTVADTGARELKYIISQLRFFVGARTHATIAAYSSQVPTLTVGYSVKARGIALDLFDSEEHYVLPVQSLERPEQLTQAFIWLMEHEQPIKQRLGDMIPAYQGLASGAALYLERVLNGKELLIPAASTLAAKSRCTGCGLCAQICNGAIHMETDAEGFRYPQTDAELCENCGRCHSVCPATQPRQTIREPEQAPPEAYAAKLIDEKTRRASSSGGIFTPLALDILRYGGYVCGAAYDDNLNVRHIIIDDEHDLPRLRGSKYVQSDLSQVYEPIRQILEAQRPLLFTGTPCQTAAMRAWCGDHDYLLTVAVACHGVPSSLAFKKYISELEKKQGLRAVNVDFKHKQNGWANTQTRVHFGGGSHYDEPNRASAYMKAFLNNLCTRPSCHDCFAKTANYADLLIGDYWGIEKIHPEFVDDLGVSVVLTLSDKGRAALKGIANQLHLQPTSFADAWRYNTAIVHSSPYNQRRGEFFTALADKPLKELVDSLIPQPTQTDRLKRRLKKLLG